MNGKDTYIAFDGHSLTTTYDNACVHEHRAVLTTRTPQSRDLPLVDPEPYTITRVYASTAPRREEGLISRWVALRGRVTYNWEKN